MHGAIALDIDGTLTTGTNGKISPNIIKYLEDLVHKGWKLIFITGRSFFAGHHLFESINFPYYLAVQNGAIILEMPEKKIVSKKYLDRSIFSTMELICHNEPTDFVLYCGFEYNDVCYYRPKKFSASLLSYIEQRIAGFKEDWRPVESYDEVELEGFPSIKCFGLYPEAVKLTKFIEDKLKLHVPLIRDPFNETYYVMQATHPEISKGKALQDFIKIVSCKGKIIAAGDDLNDTSMLEVADVKVVMATAPKSMLDYADIIAPPASEEGIIVGLEEALKW